MLEDAYRKGREQKEQVKTDLQTGRDRAETHGQRAQSHLASTDSDGFGHPDGNGSTREWSTGRPERY